MSTTPDQITTDTTPGTTGEFAAAAGSGNPEQEPSACMQTTGGGEREAELWRQFAEWFVARNGFEPSRRDTRADDLYQAYLCGRVDELQEHSLPKNVMRDALKAIQATLDASGQFLEEVEKERARLSGAGSQNGELSTGGATSNEN